jgi:hypothetical protein
MKKLPLLFLAALVVAGEAWALPPSAQEPAPGPTPLTTVVAHALGLLGHAHQPVVIFDPIQYDEAHRMKIERFEAFIFAERREIYLNRRGRACEETLAGRPHGVYVLAALLAHELAHLDGKDERGALQAEEGCVFRFMKEGRIPVDVALDHLRSAWRLRR